MSSTPAPTAAAQQSSSKNRWKQLFRVLGVVVAVTLIAFLSVRLWMIAAVLGIDQFGFVAAVIQSVLVFGLIAYIFRASDWTGFQGYEDITEEIDTSVAGAKLWKAKTRKPVRGKTLWDWMQLLAAPGDLVASHSNACGDAGTCRWKRGGQASLRRSGLSGRD